MSYFCAIFKNRGISKPIIMISNTQIRQLSEVAKVGNLKISSLNLSVSESALNMCIIRAEKELGVTLFSRKDHSLIITESSKSVFDLFERLLEIYKELEEKLAEIKNGHAGPLRLAIQDSVAPYISPKLYHNLTKESNLKCAFTQCDCASLVKRLIDGEVEFGILLKGNKPAGFREKLLYADEMVGYLSPSYAEKGGFNPRHIVSEKAIIMSETQNHRKSHQIDVEKSLFEGFNYDSLMRYVDLIEGYTLVPKMQMAYMNEEQRTRVRPILETSYQKRHVCIVYRKKRGHEQEYFLNLLTETIGDIVKIQQLKDEKLL